MSTKQSVIEDAFAVMGILDEEVGMEPAMLQRGLQGGLQKLVRVARG